MRDIFKNNIENNIRNIYWTTKEFFKSLEEGNVLQYFRDNFSESVKACGLYQNKTSKLEKIEYEDGCRSVLSGNSMIP